MYKMCQDIDQMVAWCQGIFLSDENIPIPYQQARMALRNNDVKLFVMLMGSLIKSVPYSVHKEKLDEGYFHTIIHVITAVLKNRGTGICFCPPILKMKGLTLNKI